MFYDFPKRGLKRAQHKHHNPYEVFMAVASPAGRNLTSWQFLHRLGGSSCQSLLLHFLRNWEVILQMVSK